MAIKKDKAQAADREGFYVRLRQSPALRKETLEAVRDTLDLMKRQRSFLEKRQIKLLLVRELAEIAKDSAILCERIHAALPKESLAVSAPAWPAEKKALKKKGPIPAQAGPYKSLNLDKLERSISEIEDKLSGMLD